MASPTYPPIRIKTFAAIVALIGLGACLPATAQQNAPQLIKLLQAADICHPGEDCVPTNDKLPARLSPRSWVSFPAS